MKFISMLISLFNREKALLVNKITATPPQENSSNECVDENNNLNPQTIENEQVDIDVAQEMKPQNPCVNEAFNIGISGLPKESIEFQECVAEAHNEKDKELLEEIHASYEEGCSEIASVEEETSLSIDCNDLASALMGNAITNGAKEADKNNLISSYMNKILSFRTWQDNVRKMKELKVLVNEIKAIDPKKGLYAEAMLANGKQISEIYNQAYKLGMQNQKEELSTLEKKASKLGARRFEKIKIAKSFEKGLAKASTSKKSYKVTTEVPSYDLNTAHPFFISNLPQEKHWNIFADETGSLFDKNALLPKAAKKEKGKIVALFVPKKSPLTQLSYNHATDDTSEAAAKLINEVLTKGKGTCGVLGVNLDGMASVDIDYWFNGYERLFDLILRLLPFNPEGTILDFYIENRGDDNNENKSILQRIADGCLYRFAKTSPELALKITINIKCEKKKETTNRLFIAHNGYVDALACAWNGSRKELVKVLRKCGLINRCLLEGDVQELPLVMDQLSQGQIIPIKQWQEILVSPDANIPDSLVRVLLNKLGNLLRNDVDSWKKYVAEVVLYLDSKAIDMNVLSKQINFLSVNRPISVELPTKLKMIWTTAQLAEKNHRGMISETETNELASLIEKMYLEDASLCCWSTLHIAVEETNAFRFECARNIIMDFAKKFNLFDEDTTFSDIFPDGENVASEWMRRIMPVGIRYYGRMFSSLGQHESFMGNFERADEYFRIAMKCYEKLAEGREGEISQTMSYYVINKLDYEKDYKTLLPLMEEYLGGEIEAVMGGFATSSEPKDKYKHAIALRFLIEIDSEFPALKSYMQMKKEWKTAVGHPWEMIEFYRALLVTNPEQTLAHLHNAYKIALEGGSTLMLIASVILGGIYFYDSSVKEEYIGLVNCVKESLPALGNRIDVLEKHAVEKMKPLDLAKAVLPFNFR